MIGHASPISGVAAHGDLVATVGYDNRVVLWHHGTHTALACGSHDHLANQCEFSPDGRLLATASADYSVRVWSVPDLSLHAVLGGHGDDVDMVAFSPNGLHLATTARDHLLRVFGATGTLQSKFRAHERDVLCVLWSGHDELVTSSDDGTIRRWDVHSGRCKAIIDLGGAQTDTITVDHHGRIFGGDDSGHVFVIDGRSCERQPAHEAGIKRVVLAHDSGLLLTTGYDGVVRFWRTGGSRPVLDHATEAPAQVWMRAAAFTAAGSEAVFGTFGTTYATYRVAFRQWDCTAVAPTHGLNAVHATDRGAAAAAKVFTVGDAGIVWRDATRQVDVGSPCNFLADLSNRLVTGGQAGRLFDAGTGEILYRHHSPLNCTTGFIHNGIPYLVVGTYTGEGLVFRATTGAPEHVATLRLHENAVKGLAASRNVLFSVCATGALATHDLARLGAGATAFVPHAHTQIANGVASLGDERFATVSRDLGLRIWTVAGMHGEIGNVELISTPHDHSIKCVAVSTDGRYIATGSFSGVVAIFDVNERTWSHVSRPTTSGISCLIPVSSRSFLASSWDGQVYTVPCGPSMPLVDLDGTARRRLAAPGSDIVGVPQRPPSTDEPSSALHDAIRGRRSHRSFGTDEPSDPELDRLFEAARWAPSCWNTQPWRFVVARRSCPESHERLLTCLSESNQRWARSAPVLVLAVAKLDHDSGKPNPHAFHDVGLATANIQLQAQADGLQVQIIGGFDPARADQSMAVPKGFASITVLAIGYAGDPAQLPGDLQQKEQCPRRRLPPSDFVFVSRFGQR